MIDPLAERLVKQRLICECGELTCPRVEEVVSLLRKYFAERVTEEKIAAKCYLSTHEAERVFVLLQREMGRGVMSKPTLRMDAYYYCFRLTGVEAIDRILSAVACAGKAYHHTENWNEEIKRPPHRGRTPVEWIQNAADDAAALVAEARRDVRSTIQRHRRQVQGSPGVGEEKQRYALAVLDDVEMGLQIAGLSEDPAALRAQEPT